MKFYKLEEITPRSDEQVFKSSPARKGIAFFVFVALAIGSLWLVPNGGGDHGRAHMSPGFGCFLAVIFALISWYVFTLLRASLKPSNWLLRCNATGVIINYRSFLNWRLPVGDVQAVGFDYSEIAWARTVKERRITPDLGKSNTSQSSQLTYLDLCLSTKTDLAALEANLRAERNFSPDGFLINRDYPVCLSSDGILELRWDGGISPSVAKAIDYLRTHVQIVAAEARTVDLVHHKNLKPEEERRKILELAKSGDEMAAVKLAQQVYGYSLNEAMEFVEKLETE